jgi:hypothetical protein
MLQLFGDMPTEAAAQFGDKTFKELLCYNFLYQDVGIVWYQDPFDYLSAKIQIALISSFKMTAVEH